MSNAAGAVDWHDVGHIAGVVVVVVVNPGSGRAHCGESSPLDGSRGWRYQWILMDKHRHFFSCSCFCCPSIEFGLDGGCSREAEGEVEFGGNPG